MKIILNPNYLTYTREPTEDVHFQQQGEARKFLGEHHVTRPCVSERRTSFKRTEISFIKSTHNRPGAKRIA